MGKKILTLANILVILYFITSHYDLPYKWAWLVFSAIILGVLLVSWKSKP